MDETRRKLVEIWHSIEPFSGQGRPPFEYLARLECAIDDSLYHLDGVPRERLRDLFADPAFKVRHVFKSPHTDFAPSDIAGELRRRLSAYHRRRENGFFG